MTETTPRLKTRLELINESSRVKLKADPRPDMARIRRTAEVCLRHHETLALSTWRRSIATIREALENIEDIYDSAKDEANS
jgi:hypothetical protein